MLLAGLITHVANDGSVTILVGVFCMPAVMLALTRLPLRTSMAGLLFFALALPNHAELFPWEREWVAPFSWVGALLLTHWNTVDRSADWLKPAVLSGMDVLFIVLAITIYHRRKKLSKTDYAGAFLTPKPMKQLAWLALATVGLTAVSGLARGGQFSYALWQINNVVYLPLVFLLFQEAIRGPQDFPLLFKAVCAAGLYRSLFAAYVINTHFTGPDNDQKLSFATAHADSILFAFAFMAIIICVIQRVLNPRNWRVVASVFILLLGMVSNNRRLVWAHVGMSLALVYLLLGDSAMKQFLKRWSIRLAPLVIVYFIMGWNSQYGGTYKPVRIVRSMVETTSDASGSSYWREIENWDLVSTALNNPVLGKGFGNPYDEFIALPPVDYSLEFYCPHNSFLGIFAYGGYIGFAGLTLLWAGGVYYAMRAYRRSSDRYLRAASLISIVGVLIYILHAFGDLGLGTWTGVFTLATSLTVASKASEAAAAGPAAPAATA